MRRTSALKRSRIVGASVESKPAPFLQQAQKKCGTHAGFNRVDRDSWCRADRSAIGSPQFGLHGRKTPA
jgi:hypothetical protein